MSRERRALFLGGWIVLAAWLGLRVVPAAVVGLHRREATLEQRAEMLARARAKVSNLHRIDDSLRVFDALATALPRVLVAGRDPETASVDLMRRVRALVIGVPASLTGFEGRVELERSGPLELVAVTASLESDLLGLLAVIASVEADPALAIESLDIVAADSHREDAERLSARLGVSGWYRRLEEPQDPTAEDFAR